MLETQIEVRGQEPEVDQDLGELVEFASVGVPRPLLAAGHSIQKQRLEGRSEGGREEGDEGRKAGTGNARGEGWRG